MSPDDRFEGPDGQQTPSEDSVAPSESAIDVSELLTTLIDTDAGHVRRAIANALCLYARHQPTAVASHASFLIEQFTETTGVQQQIARIIRHAVATPQPFVSDTPVFIAQLAADDPVVRETAASALGQIATVDSEAAVSATEPLLDLVDDPAARAAATEALARIGDDRPAAITAAATPVIRQLRACSSTDDARFWIAALEIIAQLAELPTAIDETSESLKPLKPLKRAMHSDQWPVRQQAAETIGVVLTDPEPFAPLEPTLRAGFDDPEIHVRRAVALAYLRIARTTPTAVGDPTTVAEQLRIIDARNALPHDAFEQAVSAFETTLPAWQPTEYQRRHQRAEDIMVVPLRSAGKRAGTPTGSRTAIEFETDRSVLVLGETGSGKTEAIKLLAHQMQIDPEEPFVVFDYKRDYQQFFADTPMVRLSSIDSDVIWNVFQEIAVDSDCDEIARAVFAGTETTDDYFVNAAAQVFADILRLLLLNVEDGVILTNADLVTFVNGADAELLRTAFTEEELDAKKHLPAGVEATSNIVSILEERVKAVFRDDFAAAGTFSVREYMAAPEGRTLVLDFPIQQSAAVKPIFRLLLDWSVRFGLADERGSYYLLDEIAALPELDMLERLVNAGRSYNCYAIVGVHAISQLRERYGTAETDSLLSGLAQEIHLRVGDQASLEYWRQRLGQQRIERWVPDVRASTTDYRDTRVTEAYPIGEDTIQNLAAGEGVVHTTEGWQRGRLHLLDEVWGTLLPTETKHEALLLEDGR